MQPIREAKQQEYVKPTREGLYRRQKETLETFLSHGAISEAQFQKSLRDLTEKMGM